MVVVVVAISALSCLQHFDSVDWQRLKKSAPITTAVFYWTQPNLSDSRKESQSNKNRDCM